MSKARRKGTGWETELLPRLRAIFGEHVERAPLKGINDAGDYVGTPVLVEAKKTDAPRFLEWARTATRKVGGFGWRIVWAGDRRKGDGPYVLLPLDDWELLEVDAQRWRRQIEIRAGSNVCAP